MDKLVELIDHIVTPGKSWGGFFRKTLSLLTIAAMGAYAFNVYQDMQRSHWEDLPLHDAIDDRDKEKKVEFYLDTLVATDSYLTSVWLYSWPDARTLIPVAHAGDSTDPLPLGYFIRTDSKLVGELVMGQCACLDRPVMKLLACPIMAENDSWGIVVFNHRVETGRPENYKAIYVALAHKLSNIIYHDHDHD